MAAKSMVTLFRILNPALLPKKYRAKGLDMTVKPRAYGAVDVQDMIQDTELLDQYDSLMSDSEEDGEGSEGSMDVDDSDESGSDSDGEEWESASESDLDEMDVEGGEWQSVPGSDEEDAEDDEEEGDVGDVGSGEESGEESSEVSVDEFRSRSDVSDDSEEEENGNGPAHSGDEDEDGEEPSASDAKSTGTSNASRVEALRILDDDDLRRLAVLREKREELAALHGSRTKSKKRSRSEMSVDLADAMERDVNPEDLEGPQKRIKMDKEARMNHIKESRRELKAERGDQREEKKNRKKTNRAKSKGKFFKMVQQSERVRAKRNLTMEDKIKRRGKHLDNIKKLDKSKRSKLLKR